MISKTEKYLKFNVNSKMPCYPKPISSFNTLEEFDGVIPYLKRLILFLSPFSVVCIVGSTEFQCRGPHMQCASNNLIPKPAYACASNNLN